MNKHRRWQNKCVHRCVHFFELRTTSKVNSCYYYVCRLYYRDHLGEQGGSGSVTRHSKFSIFEIPPPKVQIVTPPPRFNFFKRHFFFVITPSLDFGFLTDDGFFLEFFFDINLTSIEKNPISYSSCRLSNFFSRKSPNYAILA